MACLPLSIWIALYDHVFLPIASKIMGKHVHLSARKRTGIGMLLFFVSLVVIATVEAKWHNLAIREGYSDNSEAMVDMSALWLLPQLCLIGFAEALSAVAQNKFYYSEFPRSMKSIASTLYLSGDVCGKFGSKYSYEHRPSDACEFTLSEQAESFGRVSVLRPSERSNT